jgi:hypothetical protein
VGFTSMRNLALTILCVALLGLTASCPALAQPQAPAANDADLQAQATQLYAEGTKAAKRNQWDKARNFYLSAWRVRPHWQIAASLGRAEFKIGKHRDAAEHLAYFLREASSIGENDRKATEAMLVKARAQVGALSITVNENGAEIFVDGARVGTTPLQGEVFVEPGARAVEAKLEGFVPESIPLKVEAGGTLRINLQLKKVEPEKPAVVVRPPPPPPPPPPQKEPDEQVNHPVVVIGAATGVVAVLAAFGFTVASEMQRDKRGDEKPYCKVPEECDEYNKAEIARAGFGTAAIASGIAAGVFGAATLTYVLAKRPSPPKSAARSGLVLGVGMARATVTVLW